MIIIEGIVLFCSYMYDNKCQIETMIDGRHDGSVYYKYVYRQGFIPDKLTCTCITMLQ